ncbi:hypothetical protein C1645_741357 [Glomus cerebriforme]|uniref:Uncharacterized protein n=1 Tax=Glomus cerebriforme TaxID=658196 RepID=A0A397SHS2_9GLOM|nr:hypothetical protein C1645_741357 [Glomus cerebriforme]
MVRTSQYYVAISPDGNQVAIFNSDELTLSIGRFEDLNKLIRHEPFENDNKNRSNISKWSLSISNELNGEILIALSRLSMTLEDKRHNRKVYAFLRGDSGSLNNILKCKSSANNKTEALDALEKGEMSPATWIYSTLNREFIHTIDGLGGTVKFLSSTSTSNNSLVQEIVIVHHIGITKTTIPLNYRQYGSSTFYKSLNKTLHERLYDKNSFKPIELYFPSKIIDSNTKDNSFFKNIKKNYFFVQECKLNILECYNLEGSSNGELIKSFHVDSNNKHYTKEIPNSPFSNTFKNNTIIEISKNEKLLAYYSGCTNRNNITLFLMENSLEICTKEFTNIQNIIYIQFICNDEKLLIIGEQDIEINQVAEYLRGPVFIVWDLFSSNSEDSIKIIYDSSNLSNAFRHHSHFASSNGNIIYVNEDGTISSLLHHQALINILNTFTSNRSLNPLDLEIIRRDQRDRMIYEPWNGTRPKISVFLDEDQSIQLIIGVNSVQVWRRKLLEGKRSSSRLEYIWLSHNQIIKIKSLSKGMGEFLLKFTLCDEINSRSPENEVVARNRTNSKSENVTLHWPYNVSTLKHACVALEHFYQYHLNDNISPTNKPLFDELQTQVQNIVKNFIKFHPIIFKLTDIRFDIMENLIRGNCISLIKKILFTNVKYSKNLRSMSAKTNNHLHFPRLYSWDSNSPKKSDLEVAIKSITGVHRKETLIVGYLLDYYSDNAMQNTGWMFTVTQALPHLYDQYLDYYVRELFYKPCFGAKHSRIDQSLISYELRKGQYKNVHAINIQRGLLRKPDVDNTGFLGFKEKFVNAKRNLKKYLLDIRKHDPSVMTNLCIVPLPDFLVYPQDFFDPINLDLNSNGVPLRDYTVAISLTTLVMWIEMLLLLRFFSVASILLITVMQNMLIAFMTSVFDDARASGRQAVLKFRAELICDYETLEKAVTSRKDERNGNKENPRYLYYVAKVNDVEHWEDKGKKYRKMHKTILVDKFDALTDDEDDEKVNCGDNDRKSGKILGIERDIIKSYSIKSKNFNFCGEFRNVDGNEGIENKVEKLEQKMNEIQKEIENKFKLIIELMLSKDSKNNC